MTKTMWKSVLLCLATFHCVLTLQLELGWEKYKLKYGKKYPDAAEDALRRTIWAQSREHIQIHNEAVDRGRHSYLLGMNQFWDMTEAELMSLRSVMPYSEQGQSRLFTSTKRADDLPAEVDWRKKGVVTPVVYQGDCGSGYTFSAAGSLAGRLAILTGNLTRLSEQNLLDCSKSQGNDGCDGGTMAKCFQYIAKNKGIDSDKSYPYQARDGSCRFNRSGVAGSDLGYHDIQSGNESALQQAVAEIGPIATAIDASQHSFAFYTSGVYDDPNCSSTRLDHGMLLVGYGHDASSGKDYWILKNTYSAVWGMDGYMYIARNRGNRCGVATMASYPYL